MTHHAIKIDKGIPLPPRGGRQRYPWQEMEVGDSFFVEGASVRSLSAAAAQVGRRSGRKFSLRTVEGGVRCWRVA